MYDIDILSDRINNIKAKQKYIFEKSIDKDILKKFIEVILKIGKKTKFIIKGSRALNKLLKSKIFPVEEELYKDFDILSVNPVEDIKLLHEELTKEKIIYRVVQSQFKESLYTVRLADIFELGLVDLIQISEEIYNIIPTYTINGVKYVSPEFYKVDAYSILSKYTDQNINFNHIEKTAPRISIVEKEFPYKKKQLIKTVNIKNICDKIIDKIKNTHILITGVYAYNKLIEPVNVPYLEVFINKRKQKIIEVLISSELKQLGIKYNIVTYNKFGEMLNKFKVYMVDNKPLLFIYELVECISYIEKNNIKYSSYYHLMNYFNLTKFINKIHNIYVDNNEYFLNKLNKKTQIFKPICTGEFNAGLADHQYLVFNKDTKGSEINKYLTNRYDIEK